MPVDSDDGVDVYAAEERRVRRIESVYATRDTSAER